MAPILVVNVFCHVAWLLGKSFLLVSQKAKNCQIFPRILRLLQKVVFYQLTSFCQFFCMTKELLKQICDVPIFPFYTFLQFPSISETLKILFNSQKKNTLDLSKMFPSGLAAGCGFGGEVSSGSIVRALVIPSINDVKPVFNLSVAVLLLSSVCKNYIVSIDFPVWFRSSQFHI